MQQSNNPPINSSAKAPVSERKIAANRANAQHSTGPRTPEGKRRSSLNALHHGILARSAFNPEIDGEERRAEWEELLNGLTEEYQPRTMTEIMTVQQLAGCYWRLAKIWTYEMEAAWRARAIHNAGVTEYKELAPLNFGYMAEQVIRRQHQVFENAGLGEVNLPLFASANTILRYQGAVSSMMTKCLTLLERRRKERMKSQAAGEPANYMNEAGEAGEASGATGESTKNNKSQKRTQKDAVDAALPSDADAKSADNHPVDGAPDPSDTPGSA